MLPVATTSAAYGMRSPFSNASSPPFPAAPSSIETTLPVLSDPLPFKKSLSYENTALSARPSRSETRMRPKAGRWV